MSKLKQLFKRLKEDKIDNEVKEPISTLELEEALQEESSEEENTISITKEEVISKEMVQSSYKTFLQLFHQSSKRYYIILYLVLAKDQNRSFMERLHVLKNAMKD